MDEELSRRLAAIEQRIAAIEGRLPPPLVRAMGKPAGPELLDPDRLARQRELIQQLGSMPAPDAANDTDAAAEAAGSNAEPLAIPFASLSFPEEPAASAAASGASTVPEAPPEVRQPPRPAATPAARPGNLEQAIGLKWAGWIGAIVLVIGTAFGIEYAYDQGWFTGMPAAARVLLLLLAGGGLIGLGEIIYRRVNHLAATGFFGAGVALLFMAGYVGHGWYGLYSQPIAVGIMAIAAAVGLAIAGRANQVSVAFVAVLGGTITPALLHGGDFKTLPFCLYLLLLQAMAIGLCVWRKSPKWWSLRGLSLATTFFWTLAIISPDLGPPPRAMATVFALLFAAIYQGELLWTTYRRAAVHPTKPAAGVAFSFFVTAGLAAWLMALMLTSGPHARGGVLVVLAGVVALIGRVLAWREDRDALRVLGRSFDTQAVALLALAVPVALHGPAVLFGWMLLAAGLAVLSIARRDLLSLVMATLVWLLSIVDWFNAPTGTFDGRAVWLMLHHTPVLANVVIGAALMLSGHLIAFAWRARDRGRTPSRQAGEFKTAGFVFDAAAALTFGVALQFNATPTLATVAFLAYGLALLAVTFVPVLVAFTPIGAAAIGVTAVKWMAFDVLLPRMNRGIHDDAPAFWNRQTAIGIALAASIAVAGRAMRRYDARRDAHPAAHLDAAWAVVFALAFLVVAFTLGVAAEQDVWLRQRVGGLGGWPPHALLQLLATIIAAGCGAVWVLCVRQTVSTPQVRRQVADAARVLAFLLLAKFILIDVNVGYVDGNRPTAALLLNVQVLAAATVGALLVLTGRIDRPSGTPGTGLAVLLLLLFTGSAEIDRYAVGQTATPAWIVRQVGWSIYWGGLAVLTLILGFIRRRRPLRLVALGLLAVTLVKMTVVDLAGVGTGWRILSFLALGVLLLATSVLYGKFKDGVAGEVSVGDAA